MRHNTGTADTDISNSSNTPTTTDALSALVAALPVERPRLVRLCVRLVGDASVAEDLTQETLLEAWRNLHKLADLSDPHACSRWLSAIARNVCLRWLRQHGREALWQATLPQSDTAAQHIPSLEDTLAGDFDIEIELERDELARLLDRAMALLPPMTRVVLIESYIHESPHAEIAARLGVSEDAIAHRLQRGRLALRRMLTTDLREDAATFGILTPSVSAGQQWQETRIWCPFCGRHRLRTRIWEDGTHGYLCPGECVSGGMIAGQTVSSITSDGLTSAKSILSRHCLALDLRYRDGLVRGATQCLCCGQPAPVQLSTPETSTNTLPSIYGVHIRCSSCRGEDYATAWHLALDTPAAIRFWRRHPRMAALPVRELEHEGRPALLSGFVSLDGNARLDLISARDTFELLSVHAPPNLTW